MDLYNTNFYLEDKRNWYLDIPRIIAQKSTRLVLGKGLLLQSEDEKLLNDWNNFYYKDKWFEKLAKFLIQNSLLGRCVLFWMLNKDGSLSLTLPSPSFMNRVAKINEQEQSAELFFTNIQADNQSLTWITITPEIVNVKVFNSIDKEIILGTTKSKVMPENAPDLEYNLKNPFGFLPIVEITNLPNPLLFGQSTTLNGYPDCMPVADLINDANHIIKQKRKERVLNQTRIYGKVSNEKLLDLLMGKSDISEFIEDAFIEVASMDYDTVGKGGVQVVQGAPKFSEYFIDYNGTMKSIYNGAGYDYEEFNGVNYENKTKSLMNNKLDMETTEFKIAHYKPYIQRLIDIWMIINKHWDGKVERPYSFDFLPIAMTDQLKEIEFWKFQLDYKLASRFEAIGAIRGINNLQAKVIAEKAMKEWEQELSMLGDDDNNGSDEQRNLKNISKTSTSSIKDTTSKN